ncbi:MAG: hypothetical protein JNL12_18540 [Planctomycetes bacterium]|nr:hypothetical protein [Planctomycetota bacterium]
MNTSPFLRLGIGTLLCALLGACATHAKSPTALDHIQNLRDRIAAEQEVIAALLEQAKATDAALQQLVAQAYEGSSVDALRGVSAQLAAVDEQHAEVEASQRELQQLIDELARSSDTTLAKLREDKSPLADLLTEEQQRKQAAAAAWRADIDTLLQRSTDYRERLRQSIDVLSHSLSAEMLQQMAKEKAPKEASAALNQAATVLDGSLKRFDTLLRPDEKS